MEGFYEAAASFSSRVLSSSLFGLKPVVLPTSIGLQEIAVCVSCTNVSEKSCVYPILMNCVCFVSLLNTVLEWGRGEINTSTLSGAHLPLPEITLCWYFRPPAYGMPLSESLRPWILKVMGLLKMHRTSRQRVA